MNVNFLKDGKGHVQHQDDGNDTKKKKKDKNNYIFSKSLTDLLRHKAPTVKTITVHPGGYVLIDEILTLPRFQNRKLDEIIQVVNNCNKQRFHIKTDDKGKLMIRANQGHTFPIDESELLEPITNPQDYPIVIHGTYRRSWDSISKTGLSRMKRNHIHFAPGFPGSDEVISGMRNSVELYVYIDIKKAMDDGIKFYRSTNNVILTSGNEDGYLLPKYFSKVEDKTRGIILLSSQ